MDVTDNVTAPQLGMRGRIVSLDSSGREEYISLALDPIALDKIIRMIK